MYAFISLLQNYFIDYKEYTCGLQIKSVSRNPPLPPLPRHSWTLSLSTADVSLNGISSFVYKKTVKLKEKEPT